MHRRETQRHSLSSRRVAGIAVLFLSRSCESRRETEAQSRGGLANKMATLPADAPDVKVEDGADVVKLLSETINQVRRGEIDPRVANAVGYLSNIVRAATGQREVESRIAELESLVKSRSKSDGRY